MTLRLDPQNPGDLARAADLLRAGGTVAFPTETVYGLGSNALDPAAVARIFAAKQRPAWDPLIVHLASIAGLAEVTEIDPALQSLVNALAEAFWPGPLTLLLPRAPRIPDSVTAGRPLVGIRVPAHPVALELLRLTQLPIAAPSANTFGHTSPTTAAHVLADLTGRIDAVLDGGATAVGVESTVLDPQRMIVYRPGAVTLDQIEAVCGLPATLYVAPAAAAPQESLPSPGVGIRHYAPRAKVVLIEGTPEALQSAVETHSPTTENREPTTRIGIMLPDDWPAAGPPTTTFRWGNWKNPEELASRLFAGLRELDDRGATLILCPLPPPTGLGQAIRDRLEKASREF
jgi:L-threonylcarbamoyladenylate synthase